MISRKGMCLKCEMSVDMNYLFCKKYNKFCKCIAWNCAGPFQNGKQNKYWNDKRHLKIKNGEYK